MAGALESHTEKTLDTVDQDSSCIKKTSQAGIDTQITLPSAQQDELRRNKHVQINEILQDAMQKYGRV